jgi:hypothetical protein
MRHGFGFMEFGKKHSQVHLDSPDSAHYVSSATSSDALVAPKLSSSRKFSMGWRPANGFASMARSYAKQFIDETGDIRGAFPGIARLPSKVTRKDFEEAKRQTLPKQP